MGRPLIGLTTYALDQQISGRQQYAASLPMAYVRAVHANGGRAVLIAPDDPGQDVLDHLDGIVFAGGSDVDPVHYGEAPHPTVVSHAGRDAAELMLLRAALDRDLPLLGVCRGLQLMAIVSGGRLHQHLPDALGTGRHRPASGYGEHRVRLAAGTLCHKVLGDEVVVNSLHHQGIADPGTLVPTGWCPDDDLIETAEIPERRFAIGVQWHPEAMADQRVFRALIESVT
jgi:putative glutamine amidotransferase